MSVRTEKEILDNIETQCQLGRKDLGVIKKYVAAGFWIFVITLVINVVYELTKT